MKFQSLFYWISLCNDYVYEEKRKMTEFQSLFYWISLCNQQEAVGSDTDSTFQSLFYWISLCNTIAELVAEILSTSFNPCFIGLASATYKQMNLRSTVGDSFNPCFIGLASATYSIWFDSRLFLPFQSLFYWISLCNPVPLPLEVSCIRVSILVLLD